MLLLGHKLLSVFSNSALISFGVSSSFYFLAHQIEQSREKPGPSVIAENGREPSGWRGEGCLGIQTCKERGYSGLLLTQGLLGEAEGQVRQLTAQEA